MHYPFRPDHRAARLGDLYPTSHSSPPSSSRPMSPWPRRILSTWIATASALTCVPQRREGRAPA